MFAVPGWAVSARSLVSETPRQAPKASSKPSSADGLDSKKRKRSAQNEEISRKVRGSELEKLWNGAFGDAQTTKPDHALKKKSKQDGEVRLQAQSQRHQGEKTVADNVQPSGHENIEKKEKQHGKNEERSSNELKKVKHKAATTIGKNTSDNVPERNGSSKRQQNDNADSHQKKDPSSPTIEALKPPQPAPPPQATNLTPLQIKMRNKLTSARFRHLNQTLYTTSSEAALKLFTESPELFTEYHAGFSQQVKDSWPQNPVDEYIKSIKTRGQLDTPVPTSNKAITIQPLPRRKTGSCTIADLGCGDAPLARGCQSQTKALQLKFHNYDLHAANSHITVADISDLPLRDGEADIVVFCLSLMGTNWITFVEEAWRILRGDGKGEIWVAEVKSRFGRPKTSQSGTRVVDNSVGKRRKPTQQQRSNDVEPSSEDFFAEDAIIDSSSLNDETDISAFVDVFQRRGFVLKPESLDKSNKMFVSMIFLKSGVPVVGKHKGLKWTGREYQRQQEGDKAKPRQEGKTKFIDTPAWKRKSAGGADQLPDPEEEAKVLKPCVYKLR